MTRTVAKAPTPLVGRADLTLYQSSGLKNQQSSLDRLVEEESKNYHQLSTAEQMAVDMRILKKLKLREKELDYQLKEMDRS